MSATHPSFVLHGPAEPRTPLVLDSPHSGFDFPSDFGAIASETELRDGEDCFVDQLWMPATERGVGLIAASVPRTYIDYNRHPADIDLELVEGGRWPHQLVPSGKGRIGKALVWRTLDDGRPIYDRKLTVAEIERRIHHYHQPYHHALARRIEATHAAFGASWHIDCHSMNAVSGSQGEGGAGKARPDMVLGDRDGTSCDPAFTERVRVFLAGLGYEVKVNDPFKGVELVKAYSNPADRRMSLQLEVNKRLYMDKTLQKTPGFATLQRDLAALVDELLAFMAAETRAR